MKSTFSKIAKTGTELLDDKQAAAFLNMAPGTLAIWRSTGRYAIPFVKIGRLVRYKRTDLEAWIEKRTRSNGATNESKG